MHIVLLLVGEKHHLNLGQLSKNQHRTLESLPDCCVKLTIAVRTCSFLMFCLPNFAIMCCIVPMV